MRTKGEITKKAVLLIVLLCVAVFATFPIEKPEYSLLVILDNPHATEYTNGWKTASVNAVPLTGQILTEIMPILEK